MISDPDAGTRAAHRVFRSLEGTGCLGDFLDHDHILEETPECLP